MDDLDKIFQRKSAVPVDFSRQLARLIFKDLTKSNETIIFGKYKKEDVRRFLDSPDKFQKQLRDISRILYNKSQHYKRLIDHFATMATFSYSVHPLGAVDEKVNKKTFKNQYIKTLKILDNMNFAHEFEKVLTVAFRDDVYFGYEHETKDSYFLQKLDPDLCQIVSSEDGVYNFAFDFSYFEKYTDRLSMYPIEFTQKFNKYRNRTADRWQELDSSKTICIKINETLDYPVPPFAGIFEAIYDVEDYKALRKVREEIGNYIILAQKLPMRENSDHNDDFAIEFETMMLFHQRLASILPDQVGAVTSPMEIEAIRLDKDRVDNDNVAKAVSELYSSAGVSQLLFNSESAGSVGLEKSVTSDEQIVFRALRQLERWTNRKLKKLSVDSFKFILLDVTTFNREKMSELYLKSAQFGIPVKMELASVLGLSPSALSGKAFLENDVLELHEKLIPLTSSHTQGDLTDEGGRPIKSGDKLTTEGNRSRDKKNK